LKRFSNFKFRNFEKETETEKFKTQKEIEKVKNEKSKALNATGPARFESSD
jgi:tellurite resistance protein